MWPCLFLLRTLYLVVVKNFNFGLQKAVDFVVVIIDLIVVVVNVVVVALLVITDHIIKLW